MIDDYQRERIEQDRRYLQRQRLDSAENRARTRTAKEAHAAALAALRGPDDLPDADDASAWSGRD
jgi:GAF domain-containing protein